VADDAEVCCLSRTPKVQLLVFLFLALFVVLQVIVEWLWWSSTTSWLLERKSREF
jgi:hypothetical protein